MDKEIRPRRYMGRDYKVKDTSQDILDLQNKMFNSLRPEQRIEIMLSMCETARQIVLSSLPKGLSPKEKKKQLFFRFYGDDFSKEEKQKIIEHIDKIERT